MNSPEDYGAEVLRQNGMVALRITGTGRNGEPARITVNIEALDGSLTAEALAEILGAMKADAQRLLDAARTVTAP